MGEPKLSDFDFQFAAARMAVAMGNVNFGKAWLASLSSEQTRAAYFQLIEQATYAGFPADQPSPFDPRTLGMSRHLGMADNILYARPAARLEEYRRLEPRDRFPVLQEYHASLMPEKRLVRAGDLNIGVRDLEIHVQFDGAITLILDRGCLQLESQAANEEPVLLNGYPWYPPVEFTFAAVNGSTPVPQCRDIRMAAWWRDGIW